VALLDVKKASNIEITLARLTRESGKEPEEIVECINHLDARALAETSGKQQSPHGPFLPSPTPSLPPATTPK